MFFRDSSLFLSEKTGRCFFAKAMGAFFKPSEEPAVKRAKRSGAILIAGSSDGTLCAAIAEQMSAVVHSLRRKTLSLTTIRVGPFQVAEMGQK